jgi:hypothetical protein
VKILGRDIKRRIRSNETKNGARKPKTTRECLLGVLNKWIAIVESHLIMGHTLWDCHNKLTQVLYVRLETVL